MAIPKKTDRPPSEHEVALTLYQAFRRSNDVMFYCDRDGTILDVNEAFCRHYGWTREEAIGQNPRLLRSRYTTPDVYREMWSQILDPRVGYWRGELVNRAKDGREIPVILTITAVRDEVGAIVGYVSNAMDVGELRRLQERVAQSEALAQLGQMAAVVAHEIRNPLGSIVMAARQIEAGELAPEDRELVLKILRDESRRLNETLTNFLSYARPRPLRLERTDLNALVSDVARIVSGDGAAGLRLELALDAALAPFRFDADQIRQVAWNIALNAAQAVEGRGAVRVATGLRDGFAFLRVEDDGPGIPASIRDDLFQPFKTTKSHGTGLGLAIADRIVRAHGGRIELDGARGQGTAFTVLLPTAQRG
ncbi:MAG: PAS domain S-box protein [Elusimicrobia bacterium]|nr:PAS domain S-box protein [Elusimicrobiota bacterium]